MFLGDSLTRRWEDSRDAFYIDSHIAFRGIGPLLFKGQNSVGPDIMPDGQHLNHAGYEVIGPELKNIIDEFWR